jgi:phage shock protein C
MEYKRLYRSRSPRVIAGVAEGLGEFFQIDPVVIRIIFAVVTLLGFGTGVLIYILLWIFVPEKPIQLFPNSNPVNEPEPQPAKTEAAEMNKENEWHEKQKRRGKGLFFAGTILITLGVLFLLDNVFCLNFNKYWPVILIVIGILLLADFSHYKRKPE